MGVGSAYRQIMFRVTVRIRATVRARIMSRFRAQFCLVAVTPTVLGMVTRKVSYYSYSDSFGIKPWPCSLSLPYTKLYRGRHTYVHKSVMCMHTQSVWQ